MTTEMKIEWKSEKEPPYLFRQVAEWTGIKLHHARVRAGRMLEHTPSCHQINVSLGGKLVTQKISATGRLVSTNGSGDGNIYALDAVSGSLKWKFQTGDVVHASPAIVDGKLYLRTAGHLFAIGK